MDFIIRPAQLSDVHSLFDLYKRVALTVGGIARTAEEIKEEYVFGNLKKSLANGISMVVEHPQQTDKLIGEIHCYKLEPAVFSHVLSELTIVVDQDFQGSGVGKLLFTHLLAHVIAHRLDILRVELIARESNRKAINFYKKIGFVEEGRLERRIANQDGTYEADIPMAWYRN